MDIKKLQTVVINALEDVKAQNIKVYDTTQLTSLFDRLCIASGTSNRQTKALASSVREKVKEHGGEVVGIEGEDIGEWVLVDLGDMIIHIMQPAIREYYRLEELWGDKELKVKAAAKRATKTASIETPPSPTKRTRKPAVKTDSPDAEKPKRSTRAAKTATDTAPTKKTVTRKKTVDSTASPAKRSPKKPKAV